MDSVKVPQVKVKNRNPAPKQITAEQLLREAHERAELVQQPVAKIPEPRDEAEVADMQFRKRREFENRVRLNKISIGAWISYALWEDSQHEYERARSVFERALVVDHRSENIWMRYAEMEMKNKFVNHARNVFDRAVSILPRVDQFWFKYAYMEEMLGNLDNAREIFERWMKWEPDEEAWNLYLKFEKRYKNWDRVRDIYRRLISLHPQTKNWQKWAKFEEDHTEYDNSRAVYQLALDTLGEEFVDQHLYISFARFETRMKEFDRARVVYKYAMKKLPSAKSQLYEQYVQFEKQHGNRDEMEDLLLKKRRDLYEKEVLSNPTSYDTWFDYIRLEESSVARTEDPADYERAVERTRKVFRRATAQKPLVEEKRYWRRYIYLWIKHALFEELTVKDYASTRQVYADCLKNIPHKKFTFAKVWLLFAQFEMRQMNLQAARKSLGRSIGMCPKDKLFKGYIDLELQLREFDRCRRLYEQFLKYSPSNAYAWIKYAELEKLLDEVERARGIFELAINQPLLDMPELLWKAYIDFEYENNEIDNVRSLYRRLLSRTDHPKVWASFAELEYRVPLVDLVKDVEAKRLGYVRARALFEEGYSTLKQRGLKEERRLLLINWLAFEEEHYSDVDGSVNDIRDALTKRMPQQVKKRRKINETDPNDQTMEEYFDYVFPEDEEEERKKGVGGIAKLLAKARQWKQQESA